MIDDEPSVKDMAALWRICANFIEKHEIGCAESIYQRDRIAENVLQLLEDICDEVGYTEDEDE